MEVLAIKRDELLLHTPRWISVMLSESSQTKKLYDSIYMKFYKMQNA